MADPSVCSLCGGSGFRVDPESDSTAKQCLCAYVRALKLHLGVEIASAPLLLSSPLYMPGGVDRTDENLFLKGFWNPDIVSHLKWVLGCKGPMFRFRVVTDEKLKNIWVGNESYAHKAKGKRDQEESFNSLHDYVIDPALLILRLGFLGHTNRAMAGLLKETLMLRETALKPTWIVEVPSSIFGPGHLSYSEELAEYIDSKFERQRLTTATAAKREVIPHGIQMSTDMLDGDLSMESVGQVMPKERFKAPDPEPEPPPRRPQQDAPRRFGRDREPVIEQGFDMGIMGESTRKKGYGKR